MYFRNYRLRATWLAKCLKSHVSEHCYTVLNVPRISMEALFSSLLITMSEMELENVSLCDVRNLATVC